MGKKTSLSTEKRAQLQPLSNSNFSVRQILKKVKVSKTAVHNSIMKYQNEGTFKGRKRSGRPRVSSCREDHVVHRIVIRSPTSSSKNIQAKLMERGTLVTAKTIQGCLWILASNLASLIEDIGVGGLLENATRKVHYPNSETPS